MTVTTQPTTALRLADRWFRAWGSLCLLALVLTGAFLTMHASAWRAAFVLAHLCALLALLPLGVVLVGTTVARYARERGSLASGLTGVLSHDRLVTALVLVSLVTVAVSLSQFQGNQTVRTAANLISVSIIVALVHRYLSRASR